MATSSRTRSTFKVLLVGDSAVGKTSLLLQLNGSGSQQPGDATDRYTVSSCGVDLEIWELPNQDDSEHLIDDFYNSADAVIVMFDLTNRKSFSNVQTWIDKVRRDLNPKVKIFVVAGKSDLEENRRVMPDDIEELENELELPFYVTSARTRDQIDKLVGDIACPLKHEEEEKQNWTPDIAFEIVFLGNKEVGKSALIRRYMDRDFTDKNNRTHTAESRSPIINIGKCSALVTIIDIPGQENLREKCKEKCLNAIAAVLMYDISNKQSFSDLPEWMVFIRKNCPNVKEIFLVGGKSDLKSSEETEPVTQEAVSLFARQENLNTYETSAKTGNGVDVLFQTIAAKVTRISKDINKQGIVTGKAIIVGDVSVGKTTLLMSIKDENIDNVNPTVGFDTCELNLINQGQSVKVLFWDTAGQERFSQILPNGFYRKSDVAIIMYDRTKKTTFENVTRWLEIVRRKCFARMPIFLVGGKSDVEGVPLISPTEAEEFAQQEDLQSFILSAKTRQGVPDLCQSIASSLLERHALSTTDRQAHYSATQGVEITFPQNLQPNQPQDAGRGCGC